MSASARRKIAAAQRARWAKVVLVLLECLEGLEAGVLIIEADDEAHVDSIVVQVIQEAAAVRPAA